MKNWFLASILFSSLMIFSQQNIELEGKIKDKVLNSYTGMVLVKTTDFVYGIHPSSTHKISWKNEYLVKENFSKYKEVPFTPYILFEKTPLLNSKLLSKAFGSKGVSRTIVNSNSGEVLFNSEKQGFKAVENTLLLPEYKAILVNGIKQDKKLVVSLYNYANGKLIWETNLTNNNFFKSIKGALFDEEKIVIDAYKNIFWLKNKTLLKIKGETGEIENEQSNISTFVLNTEKNTVYVFTNKLKAKKLNEETAIIALNTKTSQLIWQESIRVTGHISEALIEKNQLIVISSKGFDIVDTRTGKKQWETPESLPLIKKIVPLVDDFLVVQENYLTKVNSKGKKVWDKPVKIMHSSKENPVHVFKNKQEALYITPSFANKVNTLNGEKQWEKDVVLNDVNFITRNLKLAEHYFQIWYDDKNHQFPVYNENTLYIFNSKASKAPKALYDFDFGRQIPNLHMRDQGYFLSCNNTFYLFSTAGDLIYKKEYFANRKASFFDESWYWLNRGFNTYTATIGFGANQLNKTFKSVLVSKDLGYIGSTFSNIYGSYESYQNSYEKLTKLNDLGLGSDLESIFQRIKKGQKQNDNILLVAPKKERDVNQIIRLTIGSGEDKIVKEISIKQSDFIIDQVEEIIYFFDDNSILIEQLLL